MLEAYATRHAGDFRSCFGGRKGGGTLYHMGDYLPDKGRERMYVASNAADLPDVTDAERAEAIRQRYELLGIKDREWYRETRIDRKTLNRAFDPDAKTNPSTYDAIEVWLDKLERRNQGLPMTRQNDDDYVEFTVEGNFGVKAVVKGPVRDMDELQRAVARLVREMRGDSEDL